MAPVPVGLLARSCTTSHYKAVESKSRLTPLITIQFFVNVKGTRTQVCDIPPLRQSKLNFYLGVLFKACFNNFIQGSILFICLEMIYSATRNYSVVP